MTVLTVTHRTTYHYALPVKFGAHRMMMRPRDSHDLRLLETTLTLRPAGEIRWLHDVFGNSIAVATFTGMADTLVVESSFRAEHYPLPEADVVIEDYARVWPFNYDPDDIPDLGRTMERHYADPARRVDEWANQFVSESKSRRSLDILTAMTHAVQREFTYNPRDEMGTQHPVTTLNTGTGTCRDFALLMMEAARALGFAARFVSGYLYDSDRIGSDTLVGGGVTHAWAQIYLPGAGWVPFDPTNGVVSDRNLIRVAVTRDPRQAVPLGGTFTGPANAYLGMEISVEITAES
jgi:transglutaminase-like putative cysteine protease